MPSRRMKQLLFSAGLTTLLFVSGCSSKAPHMPDEAPTPTTSGDKSLEQLYHEQECTDPLLCREHAVVLFKDPKTGELTTTPADDNDKVVGVIVPPVVTPQDKEPQYQMFVFPEPKSFDELEHQPISMLSFKSGTKAASYQKRLFNFIHTARNLVATITNGPTDGSDVYSALVTTTAAADTIESIGGLSPIAEPQLPGLSDALMSLDKKTPTGMAKPNSQLTLPSQ